MKQPLSTPIAMERRTTFAATTVGKSLCPCLSVRSRGPRLENVVDDKVTNAGAISTAASRVAVRVILMDEEQMIARSDVA